MTARVRQAAVRGAASGDARAQQTVSDADLHAAYEKDKSRLRRAGEAPRPAHPHHRQGRRRGPRAGAAGARAGEGGQGLRRSSPSSTRRIRARRRTAAISAGPSAAPSSHPLPMRSSACQVGRDHGPREDPVRLSHHPSRGDPGRQGARPSRRRARSWKRSCAATVPPTASARSRNSCRRSSPSRARISTRSRSSTTCSTVRCRRSLKGAGAAAARRGPAAAGSCCSATRLLAVGTLGGPVLLGDDRLVIVKVLEHRAPRPRPLSEVRDSIVGTMTKEQALQAALKAAAGAPATQLAGRGSRSIAWRRT